MLAVAHETTLTGAPMNLLHLVRWIGENTDIEVHVLILRDGPLRYQFDMIADITVVDHGVVASTLATAQAGLLALGSSRAWKVVAAARLRPKLRHLDGFDLIYLNSATSVSVLPYLPPAPLVVSHVHELQVAIRAWRPESDRELFLTRPDRWIAASGAVRDMLVDELGIPAERVLVHHEFIDAHEIIRRAASLREIERVRRSEKIPADAAIVMGAGTIDWRKGPDLFIQLATEVKRRTREPVHFVWVGGDLVGHDWERLRADIERAGADNVHFVGTKPDPMPWFSAADVFALTSREDPFPLVCLEHAALGHPIVTYRNGGMVELLEAAGLEAAAGIVDHLDVGAMADRVLALLDSDHLRVTAGRQLRDRVVGHHDVGVAAPELVAALTRIDEL